MTGKPIKCLRVCSCAAINYFEHYLALYFTNVQFCQLHAFFNLFAKQAADYKTLCILHFFVISDTWYFIRFLKTYAVLKPSLLPGEGGGGGELPYIGNTGTVKTRIKVRVD